MEKILFNNWEGLIRILLVGVLAYVMMIVILRMSGKRTLSQMKEFDFIVSVALGSTLSAMILDDAIALSEGIVAILVLTLLQLLVAKISIQSKKFQKLSSSSPSLVFYNGNFLRDSMKKERLMEDEIRSVIRSQGIAYLWQVKAVILEPNGQLSVVTEGDTDNPQSTVYSLRPTGGDNY